ncbi:MAG: phenylalanine--tRNA ligase subunit alpha [Candidatus Omnitrophica bacterium]|nr:phenylalanine--tRNA ligase subunit alpha [Candidatus Omnitrophota bacterium]
MDFNALVTQIESVAQGIDTEIQNISSDADLEAVRIKYLGRKGLFAEFTSFIPSVPQESRGKIGQKVNFLKDRIGVLLEERKRQLGVVAPPQEKISLDISMPGMGQAVGRRHPLTQTIDEICAIFVQMGFTVKEGPEIETEFNNFTGLNIPLEHPSRDAFDTFYLESKERLLLRSHTSPGQVRVMKSRTPPLAVVVPGRVYRPDAVDASHSFMFHQIEGLVVDRDIKFSDLKGTLEVFVKAVFGDDIAMRFRPHFFPFTEPSAEVDISCIMCKGKGCSVCGRKGWLEILGSGMIHPQVFAHVGYPSGAYTGFAFGLGIERIAMLKYGITDIRLFFENDLRFLTQF